MSDNSLSLEISETFTLQSFTINSMHVIPKTSASIKITISADNGKLYDRTVFIDGQVYLDWTTDDYLYSYIQENITTIFG